MSIAGFLAPVAVVVQIVVADHVVGHILRRAGILVAVIAVISPVVKLIGIANLLDVGIQ